MDGNATAERIKSIIETVCHTERPADGDRLKEDLGLDSLSLVSLLVAIEDELEIRFDEAALDPDVLLDVGSLIDLVRRTV